jgi:glutamate/tyrosine decarboxylase-like PLP-dependent enzyme
MKKDNLFRPLLEKTLQHSLSHLENLDSKSVAATSALSELRSRLNKQLNIEGIDAQKVIDELVTDTEGGLIGSAGGRFFGWAVGGSVPAALAADWLTSAWDQNACLVASAPAEAVIEEVCGIWLKDLLGLPASASFALVTGSQMAHVTCLAAARNSLLSKRNWDVETKGMNGAPQIRILTSSEKHGSVERAIRLLGLGIDSIISLPVDDEGKIKIAPLFEELKSNNEMATIIVLQAGDLNIGAFDLFSEIIPVAHNYNAWVHVDGAFGLWAAASENYKQCTNGYELADSWVTDGHKWLNVPYDCGYAFIADSKAHLNSISHRASYLIHDENARDEINWTPDWSRRGRGVATYAAIRQLGRKGVSDLVERTCKFAHSLVTKIGELDGAEIIWTPTINQGMVRFINPKSNATEADHDDYTEKIMEEIRKSGEAFFSGTTWRGKRCMRVSVLNWQTNENDIDRAVAAVKKILSRK